MPRVLDFKARKRQEFNMEEYKKAKALRDSGKMSAETFKKNFRGCVALTTGKAYAKITQRYHAWLKANGHPIPAKKPKKPKKEKASKAKKTKAKKADA